MFVRKVCIFFFIALMAAVFKAQAKPSESDVPINSTLNDWSCQQVLSGVVDSLFSRLGDQVKNQTFSINMQWGALICGYGHVQVKVWGGVSADYFNQFTVNGAIVDAGALVTGHWNEYESDLIQTLSLNFRIEKVKNAAGIWVLLKDAVSSKKPIMINNWTPNSIAAPIDGKFIAFPDYAPECKSSPEWGVNNQLTMDCGMPKNGWLKKAAWPGMKNRSPYAFQLFQNISLSNEMTSRDYRMRMPASNG